MLSGAAPSCALIDKGRPAALSRAELSGSRQFCCPFSANGCRPSPQSAVRQLVLVSLPLLGSVATECNASFSPNCSNGTVVRRAHSLVQRSSSSSAFSLPRSCPFTSHCVVASSSENTARLLSYFVTDLP